MKTIIAIACFVLLAAAGLFHRGVKRVDEVLERNFGRNS